MAVCNRQIDVLLFSQQTTLSLLLLVFVLYVTNNVCDVVPYHGLNRRDNSRDDLHDKARLSNMLFDVYHATE